MNVFYFAFSSSYEQISDSLLTSKSGVAVTPGIGSKGAWLTILGNKAEAGGL